MCACGCFLFIAIVAALVYSVMHGLWLVAAGALILTALVGWWGSKVSKSRKTPGAVDSGRTGR